MYWQQIQYPEKAFIPQGNPSEWFDPAWMAAVDQSDHQTSTIPVLPIEYRYLLPSTFFQMEPTDQVNPAYLEAWQNLSTTLMPNYPSEQLHGAIHNHPAFFQQISNPVFDVNGTAVASPTDADLLNDGAGEVELKGPST